MVPSPRLRSNTASPSRLETCQISSRRAYHSSILSVAGRLRNPKQRIWRAHPALDRCAPCSPLGTPGSTLALRVAAIRAAARLPVAADAHWVRFVKQRGIQRLAVSVSSSLKLSAWSVYGAQQFHIHEIADRTLLPRPGPTLVTVQPDEVWSRFTQGANSSSELVAFS